MEPWTLAETFVVWTVGILIIGLAIVWFAYWITGRFD